MSTAEASNDGDKPASGGDEALETAAEKEPAKEAPVEAPTPPPPKLPTEAPPPAVKPVKPARSGFDILNIVEEVIFMTLCPKLGSIFSFHFGGCRVQDLLNFDVLQIHFLAHLQLFSYLMGWLHREIVSIFSIPKFGN